ncbi:MAG: hypothetical protein Q9210_000400 [Variospora velana]
MAPPAPSRNFEQNSPITTILRQICESYPESSCLRELLQNADDAQATEIEYVLDTKSYNDTPLIHEGLRQYHGPALLAWNNSVFTDKDFESLASIGDSGKRDDPASTGKYGQGFNSCFHWTDGPWILSRQWLLFLDPHRDWSLDCGRPGGLAYDVVDGQDSVEVQNHLKTFQSTKHDTPKAVNGTVFRIPLRTKAQAMKSKIVDREISTKEISEALYELGKEIREGGMLFLRHVRKVTARVDDNVLWQAEVVGATDEDTRAMRSIPEAFKEMYMPHSQERRPEKLSKAFQVNVNFSVGSSSSVHTFAVQHCMTISSSYPALNEWACKRKLYPWVAVAAPLHLPQHEFPRGRLFSCLRLPVETNQPVHIHGLFSIVPDRGRLSSSSQASSDPGAEWNHFMFEQCVSVAWTDLLVSRSPVAWSHERFDLWPRINISNNREPWSSLDALVMDQIIAQDLPVWSTPFHCVATQDGYFAPRGEDTQTYGSALCSARLPLVVLEPYMYEKLLDRAYGLSKRIPVMTPQLLRQFLQCNDLDQEPHGSSSLLLQYCLLDFIQGIVDAGTEARINDEFRKVRLWPTLQKLLVTLEEKSLLLPRDTQELELFATSKPSETLDLDAFTPQVSAFLQAYVEHHSTSIRYRKLSDMVADWQNIYPIKPLSPQVSVLARDTKNDTTLWKIWNWLCARSKEESEDLAIATKSLDQLFIMPLYRSRIGRFAPSDATQTTLLLQDDDWLRELLDDGMNNDKGTLNFVLDNEVLPSKTIKFLRSVASKRPDLAFATPDNLHSLLAWLAANKNAFKQLSTHCRNRLMQHLRFLTEQYTKPLDNVEDALPPVPTPPDIIFYHPASSHEQYLVQTYGLLETMSSDELIFSHLLPFLESQEGTRMAEVKLNLVNYAFDRNSLHSLKARLRKLNLIPKASTPSIKRLEFRCLADTIDPTSSLAAVFFKDEDVFPEPKFFERHSNMLLACGIIVQITPSMLLERARSFAGAQRDLIQIRSRVEHMFRLSMPAGIDLPPASLLEFRNLKWLPVSEFSFEGLRMMSPAKCRAADEKKLVELVLGVFDVNVTHEWKRILGWDQTVDKEILLQQLNKALAKGMDHHVDSVLTELGKLGDCSFLRRIPCIRSSRGEYSLPGRLLLPESLLSRYPLAPYMDEVEPSFAHRHLKLLAAVNIREELTYADVLNIQGRILETTQSDQLSDEDLNVFIILLEVAIQLERSDNLSALMIPDTEKRLRPRTDVVYGERKVTGEIATFNFVHPKISPDLVQRLDLEKSFARATRLGIEFEDEDEDEYTPYEKLTTIISDTLGRYPIDSTFGEFLANADDCGATRISWILDECADGLYESSTLITEELKDFQGPALFVHNDKVFEEKDFRGFKEIGHGGKIDDTTSTGMFGRGAMTMYHFADVPMLISQSSFLVLDPQQHVLPRNKHWKRKVGVRVPLATARRLFPDQLRPFHGLEGFSMELDRYDGTLFRLPLRGTEQTLLKETSVQIDAEKTRSLLEDYYSDAQISLLFLSNVKEIVFRVRDQASGAAVWRVQAHRASGPFKEVFENISIESIHDSIEGSHKTTWRVGRQNIDEAPEGIQKPGHGADKVTECGLAACIETNGRPHTPRSTEQRVFCTLPTSSLSGLPVSVHASFAITGDRKTIPFEDFERETLAKKWNRWLLRECIPDFYIEFLKDGAPRLGQRCFDFWPSVAPSTIDQSIGGLVDKAFWATLACPGYHSYQLYPLLDTSESAQGSTPLKTRARDHARKLFKATSLKSAQFDILPRMVSRKLHPLFSRLCPNLVQPPQAIWRRMADVNIDQQTTALAAAYLCTMFKNPANCDTLENYVRSLRDESERDKVMEMLLQNVIPDTSTPLKLLIDSVHGCRIIPKLDQTLGTIQFRNEKSDTFPQEDLLFLSTDKEVELFRAHAHLMIRPNLSRKAERKIAAISESLPARVTTPRDPLRDLMLELSNIREVGIGDVHTFLDHADPSSTVVSSAASDDWITHFWSYLANTRIYRYDEIGCWSFITPSQFEAGPYVLLPREEEQIELCKELLDVKLVDPDCVPLQLRRIESNLKNPRAFSRLLRALERTTAQSDGSRAKNVSLKQHTKAESYKLLRDLVSVFVDNKNDTTDYKTILRSMKIWPQYRPPMSTAAIQYVAADRALLCSVEAMLVPWIQYSDRFIDPKIVADYAKAMEMLDCTVMKVESVWNFVKPGLPDKLASEDQLYRYLQCVHNLELHKYKSNSVVAPDGRGSLCSPSLLFDHDDTIFQAAFRKSGESHFLHPAFRSRRGYWFLVSIRSDIDDADVSGYLKDIQATYAYMQDHPQESVAIPGIREAKIWLNLHSTDLSSISAAHFDNALRSVRSLCFNAPLDTHVMERAKNFLIPYESLLRALGCHTMVRPNKPALAQRSNQQRPMDDILVAILGMRIAGQLTDVVFKVEDDYLEANRNFMAAVSELWRARFTGVWGRDLAAKPIIDVGADTDLNSKTVRYMIDFAYTGEVQWPRPRNKEDVNEVADVLDELLDLLKGADKWIMRRLHDLTEERLLDQSDVFVRPDNVEDLKDLAKEARAERFAAHCERFWKANERFVEDCKAMKSDEGTP